MLAQFAGNTYEFLPWKPGLGRVFSAGYAFDCETTLIDAERPWITPAYVIGAAFGSNEGFFITRDFLAQFFDAHRNVPIVMHHAAFDLSVINTVAPTLDIYNLVDRNLVWDTQILHRLYMLGSEGHTARGKGESTLEHCVEHYLGVPLPKDVQDRKGQPVRLSYGQWLGRPPQEIEPVYLEYLAKDVISTRLLGIELARRVGELLAGSHDSWGFVSPQWLNQQMLQWGPLTHHIQLRASIVLDHIRANGLHVDPDRRDELKESVEKVLAEKREALRAYNYLPGKGSDKALQAIFKRLEWEHPDFHFPRTDTGKYATSHDAIQELADTVPFIKLYLEYKGTEKLLNSFLTKMGKLVLHPSFDVLATTGRTTSFGEINSQNLPTDDRVRSCFVPSPGHVFIDADYGTIEMATLGQCCISQFRLDSKMATAINAGKDLHKLLAARVTGKPEDDVTPEERSKAKPINFGKPGGMSNATVQQYAKTTYGVQLSDEEVAAQSDAWFNQFPEMTEFLNDNRDLRNDVARLFGLTPASHFEHTGDGRFFCHSDNVGVEDQPHAILGGMCLKVLKLPDPCLKRGDPYKESDKDYFWSRVESKIDVLPKKHHKWVRDRQPSKGLQRAVMNLVGRGSVFTLTGRLRANATYCARHNTVFQGLAADGAKLALWNLFRAGFRIANFVHDECLVEVPADSTLKEKAEKIEALMIEGMKAVVPDVKVAVNFAATDRWHKKAKAVYDDSGALLVWRPGPESMVGAAAA